MCSLIRPNAVSVIRHISVSRRAAFHASPNLFRQSQGKAPNKFESSPMLDQEDRNPSETFSNLDVLGSVPAPPSAIGTTFADGFLLNNGTRVNDGVMLLNNEVFRWLPVLKGSADESKAKEVGVLDLAEEAWGILDVVYPKPELLILGTGARTLLLSPRSKARISELGIRLDVMSTRSAAAQYNLLATERTGAQIAAAMLVEGFGK